MILEAERPSPLEVVAAIEFEKQAIKTHLVMIGAGKSKVRLSNRADKALHSTVAVA